MIRQRVFRKESRMSAVEGRGWVAPVPVRIGIDRGERAACHRHARDRERHRGYGARTDQWGVGLLDSPVDSVVVGNVGELAFSHWLHRATGVRVWPDWTLKAIGDRGLDFAVAGYRVQVKTARKDYRELLVRSDHLAVPPEDLPHFFVRCQYPARRESVTGGLFGSERESGDWAACEVMGFCSLAAVLASPLRPARRGDHTNYEVGAERLSPMGDLASLVLARLAYEGVRRG